MKKILSIAVLTLSFFGVKAQMTSGDFTFGAGIHLGLPTGDLGTSNTFGFGVEAQGEYAILDNLSGVATAGYYAFLGKTYNVAGYSVKGPSVGQIPILVGARFYPAEQFFVGAQVGLGLFTVSGGGNTSGFEYRPQIGYNMDQLQFILSYDGTAITNNGVSGTFSHVGVSAIYKFGGGK